MSGFNFSTLVSFSESGDSFADYLYSLKQKLCIIYSKCLPEKYGGLLCAMVTGDKSYLNSDEKTLYTESGIGHILAISGLHISIIGLGLFGFLRNRRLPYFIVCPLVSLVMLVYLIFTGCQISAERAVGMLLILMISYLLGRTYDGLTAVSLLAIILLISNPYYITNSSFQLSFMAAIGVFLYLEYIPRFKNKMLNAIAFSFFLQVFTIPVMSISFHKIYPVAILLNLLILPLAGILLGVGIAGGLIGLVSLTLAKYVLLISNLILVAYHYICVLGNKIPLNSIIVGAMRPWEIAAYYFCLHVLVNCIRVLGRRNSVNSIFFSSERIRRVLADYIIIVLCAISMAWSSLSVKLSGAQMVVLDVGQGDGTFIRTKDGNNLFIDGGSSSEYDLGKYTIIPYLESKGIRKIDCWFVSHTDNDHISGLKYALTNGYRINRLFLPNVSQYDDECLKLEELARSNDTQVIYVSSGNSLKYESASFYFLSPNIAGINAAEEENDIDDSYSINIKQSNYDNSGSFDKNENSLVFLYSESGVDALFTGDMGFEAEEEVISGLEELKRKGLFDGSLECLKCAHHGSNYSTSMEYLSWLSPSLITISAGSNNSYGHPGKDAIARMNALSLRHLCTINCGQITVKCNNGKLNVYTYH